jgi:hypothetical protein
MTTEKERIFTCEPCQYTTTSSSNYRRHIHTEKHSRVIARQESGEPPKSRAYKCVCGKTYLHRGSLYNHQLNCMNRTTQFSTVSKITNDCCDSLQCCDTDKAIVQELVSKYVSDTKKYMSSQLRGYLKQRDKITDPNMKRAMNEFYQTNISFDNATRCLLDTVRATGSF